MDLADDLVITKLRCAPLHEAMAVDPIGSAGAYDAFLCVEVPLPWDREVTLAAPFRSILAAHRSATGPDGRVWRPQAIVAPHRVGEPAAPAPARVRVTAYEQPAETRTGHERLSCAESFVRREWLVAPERVVELGVALIGVDESALASFAAEVVDVDASVLDVLVCTHGRRDVCCGQYGTELHAELAASHAAQDHTGPGGVRVRRTSHTGGHRFAPTALTFPDGYAWAHLDHASAAQLVAHDGEPSALADHCRGVSSLLGGPAQAADRAALGAVGWQWTQARRTVTVLAFDRPTMATAVRVDGTLGARRWSFEVEVALDRHVPQTTCGAIDGPEYKVEPVWRVTALRELHVHE